VNNWLKSCELYIATLIVRQLSVVGCVSVSAVCPSA